MSETIDPQKSLEFIHKNGRKFAQAKANRVYMEEYRKSIKARLMKESGESSAVAQEREAYASPDYVSHLEALKQAVEAEESIRWGLVAAEAAIEVWRSQEASNRAMDKGTR